MRFARGSYVQSIEISAITGNPAAFDNISGIPFVAKEDINTDNYDIVIVMQEKYRTEIIREANETSEKRRTEIMREAYEMGFAPEQVVLCEILAELILVGSSLERYMELKKNVPTIFSMHCWGGLTYHSLGLEFASPFINLRLNENDFLRFLRRPRWYMEQSLELLRTGHDENLNIEFPVCRCGDIELYFNHYTSFESAVSKWEKRKKRINWNNIMAVMYTEHMEIAEEFDKLDYEKKICFTNFKSNLKSACGIEFTDENPMKQIELWDVVNGMASGAIQCYNPVELLLTGRVN